MAQDDQSRTPFDAVSDVTLTRRQRYSQAFDEYVLGSLRIIWDDTRAQIGGFILFVFILMGGIGPFIVPEPEVFQADRLQPPFQELAHPLGADELGRGLFAQTVHATPDMLQMILAGAVFATFMATAVGCIAGLVGGRIDMILSTIADIILTIPGLPLTILLAAILEPEDPWIVGLILTVNMWGGLARSIRSEVLSIRQESYVEASQIMGISMPSIVTKDVLPNVMPYIFMNFMRMGRRVIFSSVSLYFLGILPYNQANWGVMLQQAWGNNAIFAEGYLHWLLVPICVIVIFTYGLTLFAQGTDRLFNPRVRARHEESDVEDETTALSGL
jgi:peptide/nickel transport system permease protein